MPKYQTKQRICLLDYLAAHPDEPLTVRRIADDLSGEGISVSAVYRNLAALEEEGEIKRLSKNENRDTLYQYLGAEDCRHCLHLSCTRCGKTVHMNPGEAIALMRRVAQNCRFHIDMSATVLYGVCDACKSVQ